MEQVEKYFNAEIVESLFFVVAGIIALDFIAAARGDVYLKFLQSL